MCFRIVNAIEENSGIGIFLNIGATNVILLNIFLQFAIVGKSQGFSLCGILNFEKNVEIYRVPCNF